MDLAEAKGYLSALIDGEGCIVSTPRDHSIAITNTDRGVIEAALEAAESLGIGVALNGPYLTLRGTPYWIVAIRGRGNLRSAAEVLQLRHSAKRAALAHMDSDYLPSLFEEKESKFLQLIEAGASGARIASELGIHRNSVTNWKKRVMA